MPVCPISQKPAKISHFNQKIPYKPFAQGWLSGSMSEIEAITRIKKNKSTLSLCPGYPSKGSVIFSPDTHLELFSYNGFFFTPLYILVKMTDPPISCLAPYYMMMVVWNACWIWWRWWCGYGLQVESVSWWWCWLLVKLFVVSSARKFFL